MNQPIQYKEKIQVKFGDKFSEEDDIVIVPETDGGINVAWFLYEFIVLSNYIKPSLLPAILTKTVVVTEKDILPDKELLTMIRMILNLTKKMKFQLTDLFLTRDGTDYKTYLKTIK